MSKPYDRREFLKVGSIAALGIALPTPRLHAAPATLLPILSVGYAADRPQKKGESVRLHAARELLMGDPFFIAQGARVRIGTFKRSPRFSDAAGGVDVQVIFPGYGFRPEEYPQFKAWQFRYAEGLQSTSQTVSMTVPVTPTEGLQMVFRQPEKSRGRAARASVATAPSDPSVLRLDIGVGSNVLKLQRGTYVVALRESDDESEPNWDRQVLIRDERRLLLNAQAAFTYLVLTIDYAV